MQKKKIKTFWRNISKSRVSTIYYSQYSGFNHKLPTYKETGNMIHSQEQELVNYGLWVKFRLPAIFINQVLGGNIVMLILFTYCPWLLSCYNRVEQIQQRLYGLHTLNTIWQSISSLYPDPLTITDLLSLTIGFVIPRNSCKQNHKVCTFYAGFLFSTIFLIPTPG